VAPAGRVAYVSRVIVSRVAELGTLDELVDDVRAGNGRALVVHGDPGIGKTTLLDALVERCGDGVTVLRARGVETEAELAFSALSDLLGPVIEDLPALPAPQSAALAAALALGPPAPGDRLAVSVATLGLLRAAGRPVVAVVDDLQWLDAPSRECVLYAARRASASIAVVLAVRDPWDAQERAGLPVLPLGPVDGAAALVLLRRSAPDLAPPVAVAIAEAAAGNPLALTELPGTLTGDQRAGIAALEQPLAPGSRLHEAFARRIEELDPLARRALLVAATHAGDDLTVIAAACGRARTDVARLAQVEERGLVRIGGERLAFAHPLIRGAVYQDAAAGERRRAHRALAAVLGGEQRAWHLAAAAVGPDERVATELERVAAGVAARRGFASASAALERAARLSPGAEESARRLLQAGQMAAAAAAPDRALALLEEASAAASDELRDPVVEPARASDVLREQVAEPGRVERLRLQARADQLRGRLMIWSGSPVEAAKLLVAGAERVAGHDPGLAATMLADAANACTVTNSFTRAEALAHRAVALLGDGGDAATRGPVLAMLGWALVLRGKAPLARPVLSEAEQLSGGLDPLGVHWPWLHLLLLARIPLGELERARTESAALCEHAREAGALAALGGTLIVAAEVAFRAGDWEAADDATREAIQVAGDTGQHAWHGYALTIRTRLAGARGRREEGLAAAHEALRIAESADMRSGFRFAHGALGFLELSDDRVDEAIAELETVERLVEGSGHADPTLVPWAPDLVEAHVHGGRLEDAQRVLAKLERQADSSGTAFARVAAARCRGLLDEDFDPAFAAALALEERRTMPFERARTLLALGRRLHRARRRVEARERLREALAGFERLGAAAWAAQTRNELRAAGAHPRRSGRSDALTPQELRVAAAVRRGGTNREIAAELFLAPKTIEFHLRQIYRKLGIRSRTQLVATLARNAEIDS